MKNQPHTQSDDQHKDEEQKELIADQYADELEELQKHAESLEAKVKEYEEKYRRALADFRNLEQRVQVERVQYSKLANRWLLEALLEPLDFMEKATEHIEDKGLKMVTERFYQVLDGEGLKEIDAEGKMFDEKTMEAIDTEDGEEGKVLKVAAKGFMLHDQVLRHAKVVVGNGKKQ